MVWGEGRGWEADGVGGGGNGVGEEEVGGGEDKERGM